MNMHVPRILTAGETALVAAMEQARAHPRLDAGIARRRQEALDRLKADGLPSRKLEAWHYTDLRNMLRALPAAGQARAARPLVEGAALAAMTAGGATLPAGVEGVSLSTLAAGFETGDAASLLAGSSAGDAVGLVSTAFAADGFAVHVAPGAAPATPVQLDFAAADALHAVNRVVAGAGSRSTLIERAHGGGLSSLVTHLEVGDGASLVYVIVQETADDAVHLARLSAKVGRDARLTVVLVNAGGGLVRREVFVSIDGEHSDFRLRGMNLLSGRRHVDVTMEVRHRVEHTSSTEFLRNVVTGAGRGVFQGQIRVAAEAQKTDARMACNTLLLSDEGEFLAKPELEIFADDVACGHGATVAEINRDHLFYLMARGVPVAEARAMLVRAFVSELLDDMDDEALHDALDGVLAGWLGTH